MGNLGIKISKIGEDVKGLVDALKLILSSKFTNMLTVKSQGQGSFVVQDGQGSASTTIAHGLSYAPAFLLFFWVEGGTSKAMQDGEVLVFEDPYWNAYYVWAWTDLTNLNVELFFRLYPYGSKTIYFKYFILYEKGE